MLKKISGLWRQGIVLLLVLGVGAFAAEKGLELRRWIWDYSDGAHFKGDIGNAFYWGTYAEQGGLFTVYDRNAAEHPEIADLQPGDQPQGHIIDYPPLRLTAATLWYRWAHAKYPDADTWQDDYEFTRPLLEANTIAEAISAVLVFFIVLMWRRRERITEESRPWSRAMCGVALGILGAFALWFNPAVLWDGHCWPQWDIWPVPFFLAAVLLSCVDAWLIAGVCLAIGASFKGQLLLGAPILLIWPIFRGYFGAPIRLMSGFLLATALIALPWMQVSPAGYRWLAMVGGAMVCLTPFVFRWLRPGLWVLLSLAAAAGLALPWTAPYGDLRIVAASVPICVGIFALLRFVPLKMKLAGIGLFAAAAILALMPLYGASTAWYDLGFKFGTEKYGFMVTGSGAYNIPRILQVLWRWPPETTEAVQIPFTSATVTFTNLTRIVYGILLLGCGIGAAVHHKRRDARFLAAMVAPWLLFFMILTQMHGRYTIWAAAICPLLAGVGVGPAILGMVVAWVSCLGIVHNQLLFARDWSPDALRILTRLDPTIGLVLLVIAGILFYLSVVPGVKRRREAAKSVATDPVIIAKAESCPGQTELTGSALVLSPGTLGEG